MIHHGFLAFQSGLDLKVDSMTYGRLRRYAISVSFGFSFNADLSATSDADF